jgi:hypothetical protein
MHGGNNMVGATFKDHSVDRINSAALETSNAISAIGRVDNVDLMI